MSKSRSGSPRRVAAGLLAGALAVVGIALAPQAGATASATGDRIAGTNRYGTAKAIAAQPDFAGAKTAILATGQNFPDALAASGVAGFKNPAPIVLTESNKYTQEAKDALKALPQLTSVIIVGGTAAVSDSVKAAVEADGFTVTRTAGVTRYATAAAIASSIGAANVGKLNGKATALVASGENFPDALAGGPAAYAGKFPILLVHPGSVPPETSQALKDLAIKHVIVLGGTAAVSDSTKTSIDGITGGDSERLAGVNRYATAVAVSNFETASLASLGFDGVAYLLANGQNFPDALAGGPLGGEPKPILLGTPTALPTETAAACDAASKTASKVTALGGTAAIGDSVLQACVTGLKNTSNDSNVNGVATSRPELVSGTVTETRTVAGATATRPPGTYVKYCFDEPITGANIVAASFHLYESNGTRYSGTGTSTTGSGQTFTSGVMTTDSKCAEVIFPDTAPSNLQTAAGAASLTLATVERGAATGQAGAATDTSIEGDSALTPASASAAASGVTSAPDLLSVGNFRAGSTNDQTAVDFTFDVAAYTQNTAGYHLVTVAGATLNCTASANTADVSGQAAPGGSSTTIHTVSCNEPASLTGPAHLTSDLIARGFDDTGAVGTTSGGGTLNPLQAADVSASGNSAGPDLASVLFAPDAVVGADVVAYLFDEAVLAGTGPGGVYLTTGLFDIYSSAGTETPMPLDATHACARSGDNNSVVTCLLPDGTLSGATFVGGSVRANAVFDVDNINPNQADEVGTTPSSGPTTSTGRTDGPDLTGVAINTTTNAFGNTVYSATFTFDEDTADTASAALTTDAGAAGNDSTGENVIIGLLHLYTADGIRLDCTSLSGGLGTAQDSAVLANRDENTDNTVLCTNFAVGGTGGASASVTTPAATGAQVHNSVVGTVSYGAVDDEAVGGDTNPEGASLATGSGGTATS